LTDKQTIKSGGEDIMDTQKIIDYLVNLRSTLEDFLSEDANGELDEFIYIRIKLLEEDIKVLEHHIPMLSHNKICPRCGKKLMGDEVYCSRCGKYIKWR
jgi:hypothetical protein